MSVVASTTLHAELRGTTWRGPFQKRLDLPGDVSDVLDIVLTQGETWIPVTFFGWASLLMLWVTSNCEILVTLGDPAMNQPVRLRAGGLLGFSGGDLYAPTAVSLRYPGTASSERAHVVVYAAGMQGTGTMPPMPLPPLPIPPLPAAIVAVLSEGMVGRVSPVPPVPPILPPSELIPAIVGNAGVLGRHVVP